MTDAENVSEVVRILAFGVLELITGLGLGPAELGLGRFDCIVAIDAMFRDRCDMTPPSPW